MFSYFLQLVEMYSCRRMSRRWPMALFSHMLDVSAYNALVLWLEVEPNWHQGKNFRRRLFLQELGGSMVRPCMARRQRLPRTMSSAATVEAAAAEAMQATATAAAVEEITAKIPKLYLVI